MNSRPSSKDISGANFINGVQGGKVDFVNGTRHSYTDKHLTILRSLVRSVLSSLLMEDTHIVVDFATSEILGRRTAGEAFVLGKNKYGFSVRGLEFKNVVQRDGTIDRVTLKDVARTVAHELVHCRQYASGWLGRNKFFESTWMGSATDEKGRYYDDYQYRKRPWEAMAFSADKRLAAAAIDDLVGQQIISVEEAYGKSLGVSRAKTAFKAIENAIGDPSFANEGRTIRPAPSM
jgi:hypothetical protein